MLPGKGKQTVVRRIPSEEEFEKLIAEIRVPTWQLVDGKRGGQRPARNDESADFAEFEGRAGVGQAEAASVTWEDIGTERIRFVRTETGKEIFKPIFANLRPLIERRREAARIATGGMSPTGRVFKIDNARNAVAGAIKRLGMLHFTQRNLRSFLIVGHLDRGVAAKQIAEWQGHRDGGKLIMDTYSEVVRPNHAAYEAEQLALADAAVVKMAGKAGAA